jgi:hypothetical protein
VLGHSSIRQDFVYPAVGIGLLTSMSSSLATHGHNDSEASIEGVSEACGSDEIGGLIEQAHTEVFEWAKECFQEAAQSMADAGFDVRDFAAQHLAADEEIAQIFTQLSSELGGS